MDAQFWDELVEADSEAVCRRSGATRDGQGYRLRYLKADYTVFPAERRILRQSAGIAGPGQPATASAGLELIIVHYLLRARDIPLAGEWVGLQDFRGGNQFFVSHAPDFSRLLPLFAHEPDAVFRAALAMGGKRLDYGDLAVELQMLPRVPIGFVYWAASEDFAASTTVMFDRTVGQHLPLDVMSAALQEAISGLAEVATIEKGR